MNHGVIKRAVLGWFKQTLHRRSWKWWFRHYNAYNVKAALWLKRLWCKKSYVLDLGIPINLAYRDNPVGKIAEKAVSRSVFL